MKLSKSLVERRIRLLEDSGIDFQTNVDVGNNIDPGNLINNLMQF